jgi:hypothetical protein
VLAINEPGGKSLLRAESRSFSRGARAAGAPFAPIYGR